MQKQFCPQKAMSLSICRFSRNLHFQTNLIIGQMMSVTLTKRELSAKQTILKNKKKHTRKGEAGAGQQDCGKVHVGDAGVRPRFDNLGILGTSDASNKQMNLASKHLINDDDIIVEEEVINKSGGKYVASQHLSLEVDDDIIVEEEVINKSGGKYVAHTQIRGVEGNDKIRIPFVDLAIDEEIEVVEVAACGSEDTNGTGVEEEEMRDFWRKVGLQMVPVSVEACEVGEETEKGHKRGSAGLRSSERIRQLKVATKESNSPIPTCLYKNKKVVVEFVTDGLFSFSSPPSSAGPTTQSRQSPGISTSCAETVEPTPPSCAHGTNLDALVKEGSFEKLRRKLEMCAQEIKECEEREMDWAGGAGSSYIKAGKLKKKFTNIIKKLKAQESVSPEKGSDCDWMALYLEQGDIDPAINNLELQAKLDMQLKEGRSRINKVVNDFVERQEREVACMEDDDFSIDLECEEECESIEDEEEDFDEEEEDVDDGEEKKDIDK